MFGLLLFGAISYFGMGISQLPDVDFPVITVSVTWAGANPAVMESAVADVIEDAVMSVSGAQLVQSTSQQGSTQVRIQFSLDQDINAALQEVQTKVLQAQRNLPQNIDPPIITKTNPEDQPIMWIAAYTMQHSLRDLTLFVRDHLRDAITTVPGVGDVSLGGYVEPQMRIWLHNNEMVRRQITSQDVINAVNTQNVLAPTGYQDAGSRESLVRVQSEFKNAQECSEINIPTRAGALIWAPTPLKTVAACEEGTDEIRRISRYKGIAPTVGLGVVKQHGMNAVAIGDAVKQRLKAIRAYLPQGINLAVVVDNTDFIRQSINALLFTLGLAVLLTSLVCYLFLGTWSSSFNVILAIPVSLIGSLTFLKILGFTLNTFTLMGLSLAIGIVVDDSIMVLENIVRHHELGMSRVQASIVGARQITTAAVAASLAILAIFIPVIFMQGIIGKFFYQFGVTLALTVLLSLVEALTLTPMRTSQFLRTGGENRFTRRVNTAMQGLARLYRRALDICLNWRWSVIIVAFAVFGVSLVTASKLKREFLPPQDQSRFMVTLYTPMGSSLDFTDKVFQRAEHLLASRPELDTYYAAIGGFGGGQVNTGIMFVTMKAPGHRPIAAPFKREPRQQEFMEYLRGQLAQLQGMDRVAILDLSLAGFSTQRGYPIEFELQGPDWNKLAALSVELRRRLLATGELGDLDTDYNPNMPETEIIPDRRRTAQRAVTIATVANTISAMVGGLKLLPNKYTDSSGHREDIQVKLVADENRTMADIKKIWVRNAAGEIVPLKDIVSISESKTLLSITRYNRERAVGFFGSFKPGSSQADVLATIQKTAHELLPEGYHLTLSGNSLAFGDSFRSLFGALVLGILVAYMILASQFNSFLHPVTILSALPFSVTGAVWALKLTDNSLNIYSMIGILLLMGIVKKNSILLVDFTNERRRRGLEVRPALLEACPIRLRPILMTSIAVIAGAVPEALAWGPGAEVIRPMAIAVIGGVLFSTLLTLFVVPCAYSLFSRLERHRHEKELKEAISEIEAEHARGIDRVSAA